MASFHQRQRRRETRSFPAWAAPPYREIEIKIGEELRRRWEPPQELPHHLLALMMQMKSHDDENE